MSGKVRISCPNCGREYKGDSCPDCGCRRYDKAQGAKKGLLSLKKVKEDPRKTKG